MLSMIAPLSSIRLRPHLFPDDCMAGRKWFRRPGKMRKPRLGQAGLGEAGDGGPRTSRLGPLASEKVQGMFRQSGRLLSEAVHRHFASILSRKMPDRKFDLTIGELAPRRSRL